MTVPAFRRWFEPSIPWICLVFALPMGCTGSVIELFDTQDSGSGDADADSDGDGGTDTDCEPTEPDGEVTCDMLDNDCNGVIDDVDVSGDGFCDCLKVGIIGDRGHIPDADLETLLKDRGAVVTRTLLSDPANTVTPGLLDAYHVLLIDQIERPLTQPEAAAVEDAVLQSGLGVITLIGYGNDPEDADLERERTNSVIEPFGLAYQGPLIHEEASAWPSFDNTHPVSAGILEVRFLGGMETFDLAGSGASTVFATVPPDDQVGLAHQPAGDGAGRIILWGDDWIASQGDWETLAGVERFWAQMLNWVQPEGFCTVLAR